MRAREVVKGLWQTPTAVKDARRPKAREHVRRGAQFGMFAASLGSTSPTTIPRHPNTMRT